MIHGTMSLKTLQLNAPGGHNNFVGSKIQIFKFLDDEMACYIILQELVC